MLPSAPQHNGPSCGVPAVLHALPARGRLWQLARLAGWLDVGGPDWQTCTARQPTPATAPTPQARQVYLSSILSPPALSLTGRGPGVPRPPSRFADSLTAGQPPSPRTLEVLRESSSGRGPGEYDAAAQLLLDIESVRLPPTAGNADPATMVCV